MFLRNKSITSKLSTVVKRSKYTLPDLPYDYGALEPVISGEIMELHHSKHHAAYVNNLNSALEKFAEAGGKGDLSAQVALQSQIKFNGGGNLNHSIFWRNLCPPKDALGQPHGALMDEINREFGGFEAFKAYFSAQTAAVQGSGWGWLGFNPVTGKIGVTCTANQDPLQASTGMIPLLGIDVWEHAYYLQYRNARPDYLKEIWKIINWEDVIDRYNVAIKNKK